jgi:hypothetical protein
MFKRFITAVTAVTAAVVIGLGAPAVAPAHDVSLKNPLKTKPVATMSHYTSQYDTEVRWRDWFSGHCGNGTLWRCDWRDGRPYAGILRGVHSRYVQYSFGESYFNGWSWSYRKCSINGRAEHGWPMEWDEAC